jgi:hypothetical protein
MHKFQKKTSCPLLITEVMPGDGDSLLSAGLLSLICETETDAIYL